MTTTETTKPAGAWYPDPDRPGGMRAVKPRTTQQPAAAWYPDPDRLGEMRYFDGKNWTEIRIHPTGLPKTPEMIHRRHGWLVFWLSFIAAVTVAIVFAAI
jgi:hypothetical protein